MERKQAAWKDVLKSKVRETNVKGKCFEYFKEKKKKVKKHKCQNEK